MSPRADASGPSVRLDRLLANLGYGSRREVQGLIAAGQVTLNSERLRDAGAKIAIHARLPDHLRVRGEPLDPPAPLVLILNKPLGVVCSHREAGRSVYELLPPRWRAREPVLSTVGRLDAETSGLLLITDDGDFLHRVISPRRHIAKRYLVTLEHPLRGDEAALFAAGGIVLVGEKTPLAPARLQPLSARTCHLTITEGRYHQVRRMFGAIDNRVAALHRDRIGDFTLPGDLKPGSYRRPTADEMSLIEAPGET